MDHARSASRELSSHHVNEHYNTSICKTHELCIQSGRYRVHKQYSRAHARQGQSTNRYDTMYLVKSNQLQHCSLQSQGVTLLLAN